VPDSSITVPHSRRVVNDHVEDCTGEHVPSSASAYQLYVFKGSLLFQSTEAVPEPETVSVPISLSSEAS